MKNKLDDHRWIWTLLDLTCIDVSILTLFTLSVVLHDIIAECVRVVLIFLWINQNCDYFLQSILFTCTKNGVLKYDNKSIMNRWLKIEINWYLLHNERVGVDIYQQWTINNFLYDWKLVNESSVLKWMLENASCYRMKEPKEIIIPKQ